MPVMSPESILNFGNIQNQIWHVVANSLSESVNAEVRLTSPKTDFVSPSALFAETAEPKVVIQFSFSDLPDSNQIVLVPLDTALALASALKGEQVTEINDGLVSEMRPTFEAFVQGICLAIGQLHGSAVVASNLFIRYQSLAFPPNIQAAESVFATTLEFAVDEFNGRISWFADPETARMVLGIEDEPEEEVSTPVKAKLTAGNEESLEILMDIPLQISVELGRVKMVVKDVVELGSGSIIEIDKAAGEPVDVLVNGKIVARGEVVVIEDNFGVRITEILSQQDRLAKLREVA